MIVVCVCGQKNNVRMPLVDGTTVRCGACRVGLVDAAKTQADRNAKIVLAIVEMFAEYTEDDLEEHDHVLVDVFHANGMRLRLKDEDEDDVEDDDE